MKTLAFEFSTERRSVAVLEGETVLAEHVFEGAVRTPIFSLTEAVLKEAKIGVEDVGYLVVGIGPGSYTGVRLAISVVQGWRLGTEVRVSAVNSLENLAAVVGTGRALLAVDAQRGECAVAECENGRLVSPVRLCAIPQLKEELIRGERFVGPDVPELLGGGERAFPSASMAAQLAHRAGIYLPAEHLAPVYLREASFVKAPPARVIG